MKLGEVLIVAFVLFCGGWVLTYSLSSLTELIVYKINNAF